MARISSLFLVAGLLSFGVAIGIGVWFSTRPVEAFALRTVEQLATAPPLEFLELRDQYPEAFASAFAGLSDSAAFAAALRLGRRTYVAEGCWHCHSQQVRPWGGDPARYGRPSFAEEYRNELSQPPLWGSRRLGPDLLRRGGKHSNDWHVAHFYHPPDVNPRSVMPSYPWFYEDDGLTPNETGLAILSYVQWLGSWVPTLDETVYEISPIEARYPPSSFVPPTRPEDPALEEGGGEPEEDDFWDD